MVDEFAALADELVSGLLKESLNIHLSLTLWI